MKKNKDNNHLMSQSSNEPEQNVYYCPMHCEGYKTYEKPGDCPVCGMDLVTAENQKKGCCDTHEPSTKEASNQASKFDFKSAAIISEGHYYCPMHCEGDKTYDSEGRCPVCRMFLVIGETQKKSCCDTYEPSAKEASNPPSKFDFKSAAIIPEGNYYCPMHCEGDKTYDSEGRCPVCRMFLITGETQKKSCCSTHEEGAKHHSHEHNKKGGKSTDHIPKGNY